MVNENLKVKPVYGNIILKWGLTSVVKFYCANTFYSSCMSFGNHSSVFICDAINFTTWTFNKSKVVIQYVNIKYVMMVGNNSKIRRGGEVDFNHILSYKTMFNKFYFVVKCQWGCLIVVWGRPEHQRVMTWLNHIFE